MKTIKQEKYPECGKFLFGTHVITRFEAIWIEKILFEPADSPIKRVYYQVFADRTLKGEFVSEEAAIEYANKLLQ